MNNFPTTMHNIATFIGIKQNEYKTLPNKYSEKKYLKHLTGEEISLIERLHKGNKCNFKEKLPFYLYILKIRLGHIINRLGIRSIFSPFIKEVKHYPDTISHR